VRTKLSLSRLRGLAVIVPAALALSVCGATVASAATTSASTPRAVAQHAMPTADEAEIVIGPVSSFTTEEACVIFGEGEFPPGSIFMGYRVVGSFCELGPCPPPRIGSCWNLFLLVEPLSCSIGSGPSSGETNGARVAVRTRGGRTLDRTGVKVWIYRVHDTADSEVSDTAASGARRTC
jgi:hypothetical protein